MRRPSDRWIAVALATTAVTGVGLYWAATLPAPSQRCGAGGASCVSPCPCFSFGTLEETRIGSNFSYDFIGVTGALVNLGNLQFQVKDSQGMSVTPDPIVVNSTLSPVSPLAEYNFSSSAWTGDVGLAVNSTMTFGIISTFSLSGGTIYAIVGNSEEVSAPIG